MFGRKKKETGSGPGEGPQGNLPRHEEPQAPRRAAPEIPQRPPSRPDPSAVLNRQPTPPVDPRRNLEQTPAPPPSPPASPAETSGRAQGNADGKRLSVGKGISLSGEIRNCESLFVEGEVEVKLEDCKWLQIAEGGLVKGSAVVENAEISGRFTGELTVRACLTLKRGGLVEGELSYGELQVERGGRILGKSAPRAGGDA